MRRCVAAPGPASTGGSTFGSPGRQVPAHIYVGIRTREGGQVPNLLLENRADRPVLITDGDILIGARQNRVVNVTILVPAASKLVVPVSCVEAGRWHHALFFVGEHWLGMDLFDSPATFARQMPKLVRGIGPVVGGALLLDDRVVHLSAFPPH